MKNKLIFLGLFVLFAAFLNSCEQEDFTDSSTIADSATERKKGNNNGNGNGNGNGGGEPADLYLVVLTGNVTYGLGGSYTIDDPSGTNGIIKNIDTIYTMVEKHTNKVTVISSIQCPDGYSAFRAMGLDTLDNPCLGNIVCTSLNVRQYDKQKDSQKVFAHMLLSGGRVTMRGFIQDQIPEQEDLLPADIGNTVVVLFDRVNVNDHKPGTECQMEGTYFNEADPQGNYLGGPYLADQIPDQSMVITKLDPADYQPCNPVITCE